MSMITNDWLEAVDAEFKKPYYRNLYQFVKKSTAGRLCIRRQKIFSMLCILHRCTR